jgi:hypothetical protein
MQAKPTRHRIQLEPSFLQSQEIGEDELGEEQRSKQTRWINQNCATAVKSAKVNKRPSAEIQHNDQPLAEAFLVAVKARSG